MTLGERIVIARRRRGIARKRLARLLGADEATVARWERDLSAPSEEYLGRLESILSMTR